MTPKEVKDAASRCECDACVAITQNDYYVSQKTRTGDDWRLIRVQFGPKPCQQKGCGKQIPKGAMAFQKTGIGLRCAIHGAS